MTHPTSDEQQPDTQQRARLFPEGAALTAASLFGAVIVLAGILVGGALADGRSSPEEETTSTTERVPPPRYEAIPEGEGFGSAQTPPTTEPTPPVDEAACPVELDRAICDAAEFVQRIRGRAFDPFPDVRLLAPDEFTAAAAAVFDPRGPEVAAREVQLRSLGLLAPDESYADALGSLLAVGVQGFYTPGNGELVVRDEGDVDLFTQQVLVHELTHALDDQAFGLARQTLDAEAAYGLNAVVEGNARRVENLWVASLDDDERALLAEARAAARSPEEEAVLDAVPAVVERLLRSPYEDGADYVSTLVDGRGERAADEALRAPPTSSEEVLHPLTNRAIEAEVIVPPPPSDADPGSGGRLGELMIRQWLGRVAGEGWGGDRYVTWTVDEVTCLRVDIATDSDDDHVDVAAAAETWAEADPSNRTVDVINTEAGRLNRITGCA